MKSDKRAVDVITRMALENQTSFSEIHKRYGLSKGEVIELMRRELRPSLFRIWCSGIVGSKKECEEKHQAEGKSRNLHSSYRNIMGELDAYWS